MGNTFSTICVRRVHANNRVMFLVVDLQTERVVRELTDFATYLSVRLRLSPLTVAKRLDHCISIWRYLGKGDFDPMQIMPKDLTNYRDDELPIVLANVSSRSSILAAKRTVNDKLFSTLQWLKWMQSHRMLNAGLRRDVRNLQASDALSAISFKDVAFRRVGSSSKHQRSYVIDDDQLDAIRVSFLSNSSSAYLCERNLLIAELANFVGLRRASINSLRVDQFDKARLSAENRDKVFLRPSSQKFSYETDFPCPVWLALRICDFIDQKWKPLVGQKNASFTTHGGHLFLSSRDARPLTDRAVSQIFATTMRGLGAPKGVAIHALRAKFATDCIKQELEMRVRRGMDTSTETIVTAVAMRLGHRSIRSLYAYVVAAQSLG